MRSIGGTPTARWTSEQPWLAPSFRKASIRAKGRASEVVLERGAQFVHGLETLLLVDRHRLHHDVGETRRYLRIQLDRRLRLALHVLVHHGHVVAAMVRRL